MSQYLQFAILGLGLGALYVGVASGLLLTYRATGIVNFAQASIGMWGAYAYAGIRDDGVAVLPIGQVPLGDGALGTVPALGAGLCVGIAIGAISHFLVFRPVRHAPALTQVVVSVGLMLALHSLALIRFGAADLSVAPLIATDSVDLADTRISTSEVWMALIMVLIALVIWIYLKSTRIGIATRAASENERAVILSGWSTGRLALISIVSGAVVSTLGVIMGTGLTGISPGNVTALVVPALAVILIARFESVWMVAGAGLALGAFQSLVNVVVLKPWWPGWAESGLDQVVPFAIAAVVLLVFGKRLPSRGSLQTIPLPDVRVPRFRPSIVIALVGITLAALVLTDGRTRFGLTVTLIMTLLALSYVVVVGYLGQVCLAQGAFAGAAGFTLSKVTGHWNLPFPVPMLLAALAATALGLLIATPAFRIRGVHLAIVTLAGAIAIEWFVFNNFAFIPPTGNLIPSPDLFGLDLGVRDGRDISRLAFSLFVLVVVVLMCLMFYRIASGGTGRSFLAVRSNERAAASAGIDVSTTKLIGFGYAAFIAGVAGSLVGYSQGQLSAASFAILPSLGVLAVAYLGGITSLGGAIVAGFLAPLGLLNVMVNSVLDVGDYYTLASGIGLIVGAILNPVGIAGETRRQIDWVREALRRRGSAGAATNDHPAAEERVHV